jgi:hypothetical protein
MMQILGASTLLVLGNNKPECQQDTHLQYKKDEAIPQDFELLLETRRLIGNGQAPTKRRPRRIFP